VKKVEEWLREIDYGEGQERYVPGEFSLEFVNFLKLVNGEKGEENATPVIHYRMLDQLAGGEKNICNLCARGLAKTSLMGEYLFLYIAVYGGIPGFGKVDYALYVGDSIENNVKKMRLRLERRWQNSEFLQHYVPDSRFTDVRWYFKNKAGKEFVVSGFGGKTGVRGTTELNTRPQLAVLDDLISDEDARSDTVISNIEETVYKAVVYALHPKKNKIVWSGTPFNARDPLYKAVESGAWAVNVFPVCEKFPVDQEEFRSAWPDRFDWNYVQDQYSKAVAVGRVDSFNQELMLRIMSDEDRLIEDQDIVWYPRKRVLEGMGNYNFYITTDFATTDKTSGDFSVISVWALSNNGDWLWVDGVCKRRTMEKNVDDLFRFAQIYSPQSVGIEISGQQKGFVSWIQQEMLTRNIFFNLASDKQGSNYYGIRPNTNKMQRFQVVIPLFKMRKVWFPEELKGTPEMVECMEELTLAAASGFRSRHDDFIDTISMLGAMRTWKPSQQNPARVMNDGTVLWEDDTEPEKEGVLDRYLV
jgi:phage terminase large subunit-like protein